MDVDAVSAVGVVAVDVAVVDVEESSTLFFLYSRERPNRPTTKANSKDNESGI